jgi:uncharacterized protein YbjQ (UPF0145 family)
MICTTANTIPEKEIAKTLGVVKGNTIRARNVGKDIMAVFKNLIGGEIEEYTKLIGESREQAYDRMLKEAEKLGADGIIAIRISTSYIMANAAEILVYGTAVMFKD